MHVRAFAAFVLLLVSGDVRRCLAQRRPAASTARFEEVRVTTSDGVHLYVRVLGDGPDTVLVGLAAYLARDFAPLQGGRTLIFVDPRSRGGSDFIADSSRLGLKFDVADVEAVRGHFGISRFSLIGWSYFGAVVALYAAEHPDRVRSIVQIGPMAPRSATSRVPEQRGSPVDAASRSVILRLQADGVPTRDPVRYCREAVLRLVLRPMMGRPEMAERAKADPCVYWNEWPTQLFETMRRVVPAVSGIDWDYSPEAERISVPMLILHGTNDPNSPIEGGRDWQRLVPTARLVALDGLGHGPWLEDPERVFPIIDSFLRHPRL